MAGGRDAKQVAKRAMILGAISFRSSLEVTDHPRSAEISGRLLPWLLELGCEDELDPIERDLLATPLGALSDSQRTDANWAGESAAFFCWILQLAGPLPDADHADQSDLLDVLCLLRPEATTILSAASLRDRAEISSVCVRFVLIRSLLQEARVGPPASEIIRRVNLERLSKLGVEVSDDAISQASEAVEAMTPEARDRAAGLYFVRDHAASWFLSERRAYFD